ncbi:hypothetical protein JCM33374_g5350 [Metschnikowia sp. JCM 33374]|nr:hypothetical protein JCM33374_g5350 [Metschnikowia sp. JCM 33374]
MSSLQFPPSSPVLDGPEPYVDPFKGKELPRGRFEYPTPNPSSTVGRSSSPTRQEKDIDGHEFQTQFQDNTQTHPFKDHNDPQSSNFSALPVKSVHFAKPGLTHKPTHQHVPSSPSRIPEYSHASSINKDFDIVNPHAAVLRVPLLAHKSSLSIGRSSKSCDFHFKNTGNPIDKGISRCHVNIEYPADKLVLTCLGYNGFGMIIPRVCLVKKIADASYELHETDKPLDAQGISKSIHLDNQHTEFHVSRGESVRMPRFANIVLQIGSNVILVNPDDCDEDVTDDEMVELAVDRSVEPAKREENTIVPCNQQNTTLPSQYNETPSKNSHASSKVIANRPLKSALIPMPNLTPMMSHGTFPHTPSTPKKQHRGFASEESTPSKPHHKVSNEKENHKVSTEKESHSVSTAKENQKVSAEKENQNVSAEKENQNVSAEKESQKISIDKENNVIRADVFGPVALPSKSSTPPLSSRSLNIPDLNGAKRRAQSEEPQGCIKKVKKVKEHDADGKLIIDAKWIEQVPNVSEIENILINHLAFSRLSSTPASFLNTISAVVSKLSLQQLRAVLHQVNCIGVIYRQGKDAAGKPLEEEYYYIPEKDRDPERNKLVSSVRGHGGLRACRKTHKQYYWKKPAPIKK